MTGYATGERFDPQFPLYIVSKGRANYPYTIQTLSTFGIPFHLIVEAPQAADYAEVLRHFGSVGKILVLDSAFQRDYDACMDLGPEDSRGPGPARNFAWEHSLGYGTPWHWVMDDNLQGFWYYRENRKIPAGDATPLRLMEDFTLRYTNVAMSGPNYFMFVKRKDKVPPIKVNTRIYSCNLIRNSLPFRWRGRYNEDTILSLDLLKAGWCTVQFNAYLQLKTPTQVLPGGNTDEFYAHEGTLPKSQMLVREHPDVARLAYRFGRAHHAVNYRVFEGHRLIPRPDAQPMIEPPTLMRPRTITPLPAGKK